MTEFHHLSQSEQEFVLDDYLREQISWDGSTLSIDGKPSVEFDVKLIDGEYSLCNPFVVSTSGTNEMRQRMVGYVNEWANNTSNGLDVLASSALDCLQHLIDEVGP